MITPVGFSTIFMPATEIVQIWQCSATLLPIRRSCRLGPASVPSGAEEDRVGTPSPGPPGDTPVRSPAPEFLRRLKITVIAPISTKLFSVSGAMTTVRVGPDVLHQLVEKDEKYAYR